MPFQPVLYRLKVKPDAVEITSSGKNGAPIILSAVTQERDQAATVTGVVVAIGPSCFEGADVLREGDRVLFAKYGGLVHREGDVEYRMMNDSDIIGVER